MANATYDVNIYREEVYDTIDDLKLDPNFNTPLSRRKPGRNKPCAC